MAGADASPKTPDAASFPESTVLKFRRGTRLQYDRVREQWFIQAPERAFFADPVAAEILQLVNGKRSLTALIDTLAAKFSAPRETIAQDVLRMTRDLADKQVLQAV
ncbi:pyrroloquinoline quinone biosynthesis peptide chaperone PqqD [Acetobacter indonesiensis]|uniref:pyrroloquinoline quinone biosynthesis peptide chaperone PqqD n=1 Tax=Acetobacter indonesiensis TaxID=104101 RepID=UPI0006626F5D|nr:pyrroloquinoline quinone biosynthesis peptide chaperone PqqD [Acetobacter indonesiensis]